ncbi:MAG: Sporulation kinase E [bacterium]|nr:Sporulation kinase E [bacterium]
MLAETNCLQEEAKRQVLFKAWPDLMFLFSHDGIYLDYYASDDRLLFVPPEQFLGRHVCDVLPLQVADTCLRGIEKIQQTSELQILEYSLFQGDETHYYEARLVPCEADKIICIVREITERQRTVLGLRQAHKELEQQIAMRLAELRAANESLKNEIVERARIETELRHSEVRYHALYEDNPSMYFTVDPAGQVLSVNRFGAEQLGYTAEELIGQSVLKAFCADDHQRVLQQLAECAQHLRQVFHWEIRKVRKDGSILWVKEDARAVQDNDGHMIILIVCEDLTEQKLAEAALRESEKLAATGGMAARIAHEINNPLAGIQNALRLVSRAVPKEHRYYHYLGKIDHEIARIAQIIRLMLDLHRAEQPLTNHFQVGECVQDVLALMKLEAQKRNVEIEVETTKAAVVINFPENHLRQILYNLVQNAIDASPQNGLVRVTAAIDQQRLTIMVNDQGNGIPEEMRPHIFEPFFTTKNGSQPGGIGLGLPVCKSLVEAKQGSIEFDSKVGQGTTFRVILPLDTV